MNHVRDQSSRGSAPGRPGRRATALKWVRRGVPIVAGVVLLLALLPVLTSGAWMGGMLVRIVAGSAAPEVRVGRVDWGWWSGFQLADVAARLADGTSVQVGRMDVQASALDLLLGRAVEAVLIERASVVLAIGDPDAQAAQTQPILASPPIASGSQVLREASQPRRKSSPSSFPVSRLVVSDSRLTLREHGSGRSLDLHVPAGEIRLDRRTGSVDWKFSVRADSGGLIASDGQFTVPRLAPQPAEVGGRFQLAWEGVRLGDVPEALLRRWNLLELRGDLSGRLDVQLEPDWTLACAATVAAESLLTRDAAGRTLRLERAMAALDGRWQMIEQQVRVGTARLEWPGGVLRVREPGLVYDGRTGRVLESNFTAHVRDVRQVWAVLVELGVALPERLVLAGGLDVDASVRCEAADTVVRLAASGESIAADWADLYHHAAGQPFGLQAVCRIREDDSIALESAEAIVPGARVRVQAELAAPQGEPARRVILRDSQAEVTWDDFEVFASQCPAVAERLRSLGRVAGPGRLRLQAAASDPEGVRAQLSLELPAAAEVHLADWLCKPADESIRVELAASLDPGWRSCGLDHLTWSSADRVLLDLRRVRLATSRVAPPDMPGPNPLLAVDFAAEMPALDLGALMRFSPRLAMAARDRGDASGQVSGRVTITGLADADGQGLRLLGLSAAGELDLDAAGLVVNGVVDKPAGERLRVASSVSFRWEGHASHGYASGSIDTAGFRMQAWYQADPPGPGPRQWSWGWLEVDDVARTARLLPAVAPVVREYDIVGGMAGEWEWARRAESFDLRSSVDLTGLRAASADASLRKAAGLPARIDLDLSGPAAGVAGKEACRWRLAQVRFDLGPSQGRLVDGELEIAEPWARLLAGQGRSAWGMIDLTWPILYASAEVSGRTVLGQSMASISPQLQAWLEKYHLSGSVEWTSQWRYQVGAGLGFDVKVDAKDLALRTDAAGKPAGVPLEAACTGVLRMYRDGQNRQNLAVKVDTLSGQAASLRAAGDGEATFARGAEGLVLSSAAINGRAESRALEELAACVRPLAGFALRGHAAAEGKAAFSGQTGWVVEDLQAGFWPVRAVVKDTPVSLEGLLDVQGGAVWTTGLLARVGRTDGSLTFNGMLQQGRLSGQVGTAFRRLDIEELIRFWRQVAPRLRTAGPGPAGASPAGGLAARFDPLASVIHFMGRGQDIRFPLVRGRPAAELPVLGWTGTFEAGDLKAEAVGAFEGGALTVNVEGNLADQAVPLTVSYELDRALPTTATSDLVVQSFPGLRVDGPVTLQETLRIDLSGHSAAIPSGGQWIIEGGQVAGKAAPKGITAIFPGLELAHFRFRRLHNWFDKDAQGKTTNRMIFRGAPWSLYMNGWSLSDGTFRYEVGVDLVGPLESEYWAEADRARIPLFIKTGRVVDGRIENEKVNYLNPQQIASRILKDNVLTVTYHVIRQRVLRGGKE